MNNQIIYKLIYSRRQLKKIQHILLVISTLQQRNSCQNPIVEVSSPCAAINNPKSPNLSDTVMAVHWTSHISCLQGSKKVLSKKNQNKSPSSLPSVLPLPFFTSSPLSSSPRIWCLPGMILSPHQRREKSLYLKKKSTAYIWFCLTEMVEIKLLWSLWQSLLLMPIIKASKEADMLIYHALLLPYIYSLIKICGIIAYTELHVPKFV